MSQSYEIRSNSKHSKVITTETANADWLIDSQVKSVKKSLMI